MPDPSRLRDSTQIVLPATELEGLRTEVEAEFTVTVVEIEGDERTWLRIIGSPVVIKDCGEFLARNGVSLP